MVIVYILLGIKASGYYLGQVEASYLYIRQVAVTYRRGISVVRNFKFFTVTDLINRIVQVLKGDLYWFKISVRDTGLMKLVKP